MNVSLPEPMRQWVEAQVETGSYANASDYMRDLIRHDQQRIETLRQALQVGEDSGPIDQQVPEILAELKAQRKKKRG